MLRRFFSEKLPEIVRFSARHPQAAHRIIETSPHSSGSFWRSLVGIACGNRAAVLTAIEALEDEGMGDLSAAVDCSIVVARFRPREGRHLLLHLFSRADTNSRLNILRAFVDEAPLGQHAMLGELFIKLMARSTPAERNTEIYPRILSIAGEQASSPASPRQGFLAALLKGWASECPPGQIDPSIEERINLLLG